MIFTDRKISSVQRQLNVYGFRSISRGEHKRSFYHPLFKRGNWEVVKQMGRYLPANKNDKGADVDESHIVTAIDNQSNVLNSAPVSTAAHVKNDHQNYYVSNYAAPQAFVAAHFSFDDSVQNESGAVAQPKRSLNIHPNSAGTVKVMADSDLFSFDNHFTTDFCEEADVGHEGTKVAIQPIDYSIPMLFQSPQRSARALPVDSASSDLANSSSSSVYYTAPVPLAQTAAQVAASQQLRYSSSVRQEAASLCDWASAESSSSADTWSEMLFDLDCVDNNGLLDLGLGLNFKTEPEPKTEFSYHHITPSESCWDGGGCGAAGFSYCEPGSVFDMGMVKLLRRDSLDDVYALCADLF